MKEYTQKEKNNTVAHNVTRGLSEKTKQMKQA